MEAGTAHCRADSFTKVQETSGWPGRGGRGEIRESLYARPLFVPRFQSLDSGNREGKPVETSLVFNSLEFGGIKIPVIDLLPDPQKLDGILVSQPFLNERQGLHGTGIPSGPKERGCSSPANCA